MTALSWETYDILGKIGSGAFSTVYKAQHKSTSEFVAIKAIKREKLSKKQQHNLRLEQTILKTLDHPNIVQLFEIMKTEKHIYLITEYCSGGDLHRYLKSKKRLSENTTLRFLCHLADGLETMQKHRLIHRDLKPQNILLTTVSDEATLKIADFGLARYVQADDMAVTLCGSPTYMAPEVLSCQPYDARADLWSVGAVAFQMINGYPPFKASNHMDLLRAAKESAPMFASDAPCSYELRHLILKCLLVPDPNYRADFDAFFSHPVLSKPRARRSDSARPRDSSIGHTTSFAATGTPKGEPALHGRTNPRQARSGVYRRATSGSNVEIDPVYGMQPYAVSAHTESSDQPDAAPSFGATTICGRDDTSTQQTTLDDTRSDSLSTVHTASARGTAVNESHSSALRTTLDSISGTSATHESAATDQFDFAAWERSTQERIAQMNTIIASTLTDTPQRRVQRPRKGTPSAATSTSRYRGDSALSVARRGDPRKRSPPPSTSGYSSVRAPSIPHQEEEEHMGVLGPAGHKAFRQLVDLASNLEGSTGIHGINKRMYGSSSIDSVERYHALIQESDRAIHDLVVQADSVQRALSAEDRSDGEEYILAYADLIKQNGNLRKQINSFSSAIQIPVLERVSLLGT